MNLRDCTLALLRSFHFNQRGVLDASIGRLRIARGRMSTTGSIPVPVRRHTRPLNGCSGRHPLHQLEPCDLMGADEELSRASLTAP
jgi:hypothetical protein